MEGTGQGPATASPAPAAAAPATTTAQEQPAPAQAAAAPAQPTPAEPPAGDGPKGKPSQEQQIARLIAEATKPIMERLEALDGKDPAAAAQAVEDTKADIQALNERHAAEAKRWAVEKAFLTAGCIDTVGALAHVDMAAVELAEDGTLEGLDAAKVKAGLPHLFQAAQPAATVSTGAPAAGAPAAGPAKTIKEGLAALRKQGA